MRWPAIDGPCGYRAQPDARGSSGRLGYWEGHPIMNPPKQAVVRRGSSATARRSAAGRDDRPASLRFTVDSALLRELGERLVGAAHIALAELIKNAYDADASVVDVVIGRDSIVVRDNGHGMTYEEFRDFWMRIGSPHEERQQWSRHNQRPLTGSKGVGRLAAQFLAHRLELRSVSENTPEDEVLARLNWDDAVQEGELTDAEAQLEYTAAEAIFPAGSDHGTWIRMDQLKQPWGRAELVRLARELWPLQPPFDKPLGDDEDDDFDEEADAGVEDEEREWDYEGEDEEVDEGQAGVGPDPLELLLASLDAEDAGAEAQQHLDFRVRLRVADEGAVRAFESQMRRVLDIWSARIVGHLHAEDRRGQVPARLEVLVQWADGETARFERVIRRQRLHELTFEIRVFSLQGRQRHRIPVERAREYLRSNGGVHVYDAGFHLPYYGPQADWLRIEFDHAHRLTQSKLLPETLQVKRGLNNLPTNSRIYGAVLVDTSKERRLTPAKARARDALTIQISRDRLVQNRAYLHLRNMVRTSLDFYAVEETKRRLAVKALEPPAPAPVKVRQVSEVLEQYRDQIADDAYDALKTEIEETVAAVESEAERQAAQAGLLGSLATAGMSALAFEHEFNRQLGEFERLGRMLKRVDDLDEVQELAERMNEAVKQARASRRLFSHLVDTEERESRKAYRARVVLDSVRNQLRPYMRGITVSHRDVPEDFRLAPGAMAEWISLFQNIYVNAINAMLDVEEDRRIAAAASVEGRRRYVWVQDTGSGVDLNTADELFDPFVRRGGVSPERQRLGLGGTGLGLTIVRMLAHNLHCEVAFVEPDEGYSTALELSWDA